jgi:hypothetical protein
MGRRGQGEGSTDRFGEYYRHRITLPDGRRLALYARTREELNEKIETAVAARALASWSPADAIPMDSGSTSGLPTT